MTLSRRNFLKHGAAAAAAGLSSPLWLPGASAAPAAAHFQPTWDSLAAYQTPDWFRNAKFGIWAHWGPQCQPEQGDWYARRMYMQGDKDFNYHRAHYGPQTTFGFKDVIHEWRAEDWQPEHLIDLYKSAGAKYFMSLANHHDNLDLFNSKYQSWNTLAVGPRKDIVGGWERAVRRAGLHFAVSVHASHSWAWYEPSQGTDKTGPLAGVPYDGKLTAADGKGLWWDGLDPQELYAQNHDPMGLHWNWDKVDAGGQLPSMAYTQKFLNRTIDLIDKYHPDLVYFDDTIMPLYPISDVGLRIAAHLYNSGLRGGRPQTVMTGKGLNEQQRHALVWDIERGTSDRIEPLPWQTDTCIGDWHYSRPLFERHGYKTPDRVAHMLVDIVSKNGNLMLNIPLPGSGMPDTDELAFLANFTRWMTVNSPAIYATRPWKVFGEGPSAAATPKTGNFNEGRGQAYTAEDWRFVQKGHTLFAFALAWPDNGILTIKSLAAGSPLAPGQVARVEMLGAPGPMRFTRDADGLHITLPAQKIGDYVYSFKINGTGLTTA